MAKGVPITAGQVRQYRLAVHHLDRAYSPDELLAAAGVCGVQNTPPGAWETAMHARMPGIPQQALRRALEQQKTLLQAWSWRGVPAVFPTAESATFLAALAAQPGEEPWIYTRGVTLALEHLGLPWDEALALVRRAARLLDGCTVQSKEELDRTLAAAAAQELPPALRQKWDAPSMYDPGGRQTVGGAVVSFALRPCAYLGLVVFGARQAGSPTFTAYTRWVGHPLPPDSAAPARLARKFLHAYGPATAGGLAAWLGCSPQQAKRLWGTVAGELVPVQLGGKTAYLLAQDLPALQQAAPPAQPLALLGAHDPYLDARDRALLLPDAALQRQVWRTVANPNVILRGGQVAGVWKLSSARGKAQITLTPFAPLAPAEQTVLAQKAEAYAAFRGLTLGAITIAET